MFKIFYLDKNSIQIKKIILISDLALPRIKISHNPFATNRLKFKLNKNKTNRNSEISPSLWKFLKEEEERNSSYPKVWMLFVLSRDVDKIVHLPTRYCIYHRARANCYRVKLCQTRRGGKARATRETTTISRKKLHRLDRLLHTPSSHVSLNN